MDDSALRGQLVFLTPHTDKWLRDVNPKFNIPMVNRLAKVIKVFDWGTEEGKLLLDARKENGKWSHLISEDFKFVLKVYCPDLVLKDKKGVTVDEVMPRCYPGTKLELFTPLPDWVVKDLNKEERDAFKIVKNTDVKKTTVKKQSKATDVPKRLCKKSQ